MITGFLLVTAWLSKPLEPADEQVIQHDFPEIKEVGTLYAITGYSATSYFIYKGQTMGYEYELLSLLAKDLGVQLKMVVAKDLDAVFDMLNRGEGDLIAAGLTVTKERAEVADFTEFHNLTRQVLVQKKPEF